MRIRASWIPLVVLVAACSRSTSSPIVPEGWIVRTIPGCCRIAIPPDATLVAGADPIDNPVYLIKGGGFEGLITVTKQGGGVPLPGSGSDYRTTDLRLDGRPASIAAYRTQDGKTVDHRSLVWTFQGENDGTGTNLRADITCRRAGCAFFQPMIRSLSVIG